MRKSYLFKRYMVLRIALLLAGLLALERPVYSWGMPSFIDSAVNTVADAAATVVSTIENAASRESASVGGALSGGFGAIVDAGQNLVELGQGVAQQLPWSDAAKALQVITFMADRVFVEPFIKLVDKLGRANPIDAYVHSWEHGAHRWQRKLQRNLPLFHNSLIYSHNTFNSDAYATALRYVDPNHIYSIFDQLRLEARWIELDIHWFFSMQGWPWEWGMQPLLCHSENAQLGCSAYDKPLPDALKEVRGFIDQNRDELVVIKLEDYLGDAEKLSALRHMKAILGDLVYMPSGDCTVLPIGMTPGEVLDAGKNIVIYNTKGCSPGDWSRWVFIQGAATSSQSLQNFAAFPNCRRPAINQPGLLPEKTLYSYQEDRTKLNALYGEPDPLIDAATVKELTECAINLIGVDMLGPWDGRLAAAVWSWDVGKPENPVAVNRCALQNDKGRWQDESCANIHAFACRAIDGSWYVTQRQDRQENGAIVCGAETTGTYRFSTPLTPYENMQLAVKAKEANSGQTWINYGTHRASGIWE
jgi:hypothetical protein